ncbi:MAG: hypothetical protein AAGU11_15060, partial [Syntrophobacteraceae bacterium]
MEYSGGPELVAELERNLRIDERILKFITVKLEDRFDPEKERERKEAALRALEEEEESKRAALAREGEEDDDEEAMPEDFEDAGEEEAEEKDEE